MNKNYILVEGPEGVGKTTQTKLLAKALGHELVVFPRRDAPGHGFLINLLLKNNLDIVEWKTNAVLQDSAKFTILQALMTWDKYTATPIFEAAKSGRAPIVCDRGWPSAVVYGALDGLSTLELLNAHRGLVQPDIAILLRASKGVQKQRMEDRNAKLTDIDRYEKDELLERMNAAYDRLWLDAPAIPEFSNTAYITIDADGTVEEVHQRILRGLGL